VVLAVRIPAENAALAASPYNAELAQ